MDTSSGAAPCLPYTRNRTPCGMTLVLLDRERAADFRLSGGGGRVVLGHAAADARGVLLLLLILDLAVLLDEAGVDAGQLEEVVGPGALVCVAAAAAAAALVVMVDDVAAGKGLAGAAVTAAAAAAAAAAVSLGFGGAAVGGGHVGQAAAHADAQQGPQGSDGRAEGGQAQLGVGPDQELVVQPGLLVQLGRGVELDEDHELGDGGGAGTVFGGGVSGELWAGRGRTWFCWGGERGQEAG